jgi:hypothetical protein
MGNGFMGAAIGGKPETQVFYLSRNDFWRLKHGHNESYPAMVGKVEVAIPALEGASYNIEQSLYDAVTVSRFTKGSQTVVYRTFLAATDDVMSVEISLEGEGEVTGSVKLSLPGSAEIVEALPLDRSFPEKREEGSNYISRAFVDSVDIPTKTAAALRFISGDAVFTLKKGAPVRFVVATSGNFKSDNPVATAIKKAETADLRQLETQHRAWWREYWEKSWISIPYKDVEQHYYLSLYGMATTSRDPDFPPGLFGVWITSEQPAWQGDYHLNYNFQAPFWGLFSANRIEQAEPFINPILAFMPRGKYYSEKIAQIPDGVIYPVGIGPLGIETTRWTDYMANNLAGWWKNVDVKRNIEYDGMFWGQKSDASYCVANLSMQFYHTYDKAFTNRVYPFVKACATFWEKYVKREGERYVIYNDAIHEGTVGDMNPILSLGFVRQTMQTALDMSELLQVDFDRRDRWRDVLTHISDYPLMERDGQTIFRLSEKGFEYTDGNNLALQHVYPGGQIGFDSEPELLQIARNTLKYKNYLDMNASNNIFPTAVRIGAGFDTLITNLQRYVKHTFPNGFQLDNPHGVENWSTTPNTVNEMLCSGFHGVVRLFPSWSPSCDARFHNIRVEGAFLVSAEMKDGVVCNVSIVSEKGRDLVLQNPWVGKKITINGESFEGERIILPTRAGDTYEIIVN